VQDILASAAWTLSTVVPFISGKEDKLETEAQKILGSVKDEVTGFVDQHLKVSAACNRVPVLDGHTACVSLRFVKRPPPSAEEVKQAMRVYIRSSDTWLPFCTEPSYCGYGRTRQASAKTGQGDGQGICGQCRENQGR
jgi:aspartate-semialdehyde dehydrogenase